ncbi:hypothetical protein CY34DRAFT_26988 [Suillus luteus UH-Slu-Lm8-n1]|uniref:Uncharacterized protein n=1 Tax=Suillus luteus UH-Slu-Lm8-n1 TaxID=930992 RepID=A0A0C9Z878_9AGAM|nr:hypothetical protein CY34DRAFT_26988 [Suillus luteus UH-Slu-Lm8-n1]
MVDDFTEGEIHPAPALPPTRTAPANEGFDITNDSTHSKFCLHPDNPENFLKLSAAVHIIIWHQISDQDIDNVDRLLCEYTSELIHLYRSSSIKPNHHYTTHVSECVRNFGPLHDFWTFLFEHLNKVLKSYRTNNHGNGELETMFFYEFQCTCQTNFANIMIKASNEERGTVARLAALSKDLDDVVTDAHCHMDHLLLSHSLPLNQQAIFFNYVVLCGKRYYASWTTGSNHLSFIHVIIPNNGSPCHVYGEILEIFQFE